ncbi:hypothetical protein ACFJIV_18005 [Mucilaginibacter sp. UC70_90]
MGRRERFPWWKYLQRPESDLRDFNELSRRITTAEALSYEINIDNRTIKYKSNTVEGAQVDAASQDHDKTWNFDLESGRYFTEMESKTGAPITDIGYDIAQALSPMAMP